MEHSRDRLPTGIVSLAEDPFTRLHEAVLRGNLFCHVNTSSPTARRPSGGVSRRGHCKMGSGVRNFNCA
eukprot:448980-Alexandrium_andersonii.AAC.1